MQRLWLKPGRDGFSTREIGVLERDREKRHTLTLVRDLLATRNSICVLRKRNGPYFTTAPFDYPACLALWLPGLREYFLDLNHGVIGALPFRIRQDFVTPLSCALLCLRMTVTVEDYIDKSLVGDS